MATYGYLCCRTCKEYIFLGKWLRDDLDGVEVGVGFWHGTLCQPDEGDSATLGRKALRFVARHMDHDLLSASDEGGKARTFLDDEEYTDSDETFDAAAQAPEPHPFPAPNRRQV